MREEEIERMERILSDQRNQLNEYERQRIKENLVKLQLEQEKHIKEVIENLEEIAYGNLSKKVLDAFDQKECVICMEDFEMK